MRIDPITRFLIAYSRYRFRVRFWWAHKRFHFWAYMGRKVTVCPYCHGRLRRTLP